jgi:hypothetical protein
MAHDVYLSRTVVMDVLLSFNFEVVFYSVYFLFRLQQR